MTQFANNFIEFIVKLNNYLFTLLPKTSVNAKQFNRSFTLGGCYVPWFYFGADEFKCKYLMQNARP